MSAYCCLKARKPRGTFNFKLIYENVASVLLYYDCEGVKVELKL